MNKLTLGLVLAAILGTAVYFLRPNPLLPETTTADTGSAMVAVTLPDQLTTAAQIGKTAFEAKCAACHGINGAGQLGVAPPLIHKIYEPSHHGDESFFRAAQNGVQSHHWQFGNMPPVADLTKADIKGIISYIRELQKANGIH